MTTRCFNAICVKALTALALANICVISSCRDAFNIKVKNSEITALVVEGNINSGTGSTLIHLSRTTPVDTAGRQPETGAQVTVDGEDLSSAQLIDQGNGSYTSSQLSLNHNVRYRLHINTLSGEEYVSAFLLPLQTPPVDSLSWRHDAQGVHVALTTHDPQNRINFYRWNYIETWEIHSVARAFIRYVPADTTFATLTFAQTDSQYYCFRTDSSLLR